MTTLTLRLLAVLAGLVLSAPVRADHFQDRVDDALALKDAQATVERLETETSRGNVRAAYQLGLMYRDGERVQKNPAAARRWLEKAAESNWMRYRFKLGLDDAQYALGMMLLEGVGGPAQPEDAARWLTTAANQGQIEAQLALAELFYNGRGVARDLKRAWMWAKVAVDRLSGEALARAEAVLAGALAQMSADQKLAAEAEVDRWQPRSI